SALGVLRERNFAPFFVGNLLSNCGTWFQNIAQALLIYRLTQSSFLVGVANFAQFAAVILLAPWAGAAADRFDRRRLIVATQVGAALVTGALAALAAFGADSVAVVIGLALLLGITTAFATPALQAVLPALVPREELGAAVAMNSVTFNLARAIGPVAGALVVARLGIPWAFGLNALSYLALIVAMLVVTPHPPPEREGAKEKPRLRDSLRMLGARRDLAVLLGVVAAVSIALDPVTTLGPAFATRVFHHSDTVAGYLIGAFGVGAVTASVVPLGHPHRPYRLIATMLGLLGTGMVGFAFSPVLGAAYAALAVAGFGYLSGQTRATTLLQLGVEDHERGRIMALWSMAFLGSRPVASLLDGAIASAAGPRVATVAMTVPVFAAMGVLLLRPPREGTS
ncbi:MAG: MFS transporter, partial [Gemmatimonadetes bacterium]|nr:MFS transporter [Gemmatimonadota bacterium]